MPSKNGADTQSRVEQNPSSHTLQEYKTQSQYAWIQDKQKDTLGIIRVYSKKS